MGHVLFCNNMTDDLRNQVKARLRDYTPAQHGGPLTAKLAFDIVQANNDTCITNLVHRMEVLKISDVPGENVNQVVLLIRAGMKRITSTGQYKTIDGKTLYRNLPDNFPLTLLKLFQTTSVPAFNKIFKNTQLLLETGESLNAADPSANGGMNPFSMDNNPIRTIDHLLTAAQYRYGILVGEQQWTGMPSKMHSSFTAVGAICWWCGKDGHLANACPMDQSLCNQEAYNCRKAEFYDRKNSSGGGGGRGRGGRGYRGHGGSGRGGQGRGGDTIRTGKWAPPSNAEHNKQSIKVNGAMVMHHYDRNTSTWTAVVPPSTQVQVQPGHSCNASTVTHSSGDTKLTPAPLAPAGNLASDSMQSAAKAARIATAGRALSSNVDQFIAEFKS